MPRPHIRISKSNSTKYSYALPKGDAYIVRALGLIGLISIALLSAGFILFTMQSWTVALISLPFFMSVVLYLGMANILMLFYPGFDISNHKKRVKAFKTSTKKPRVAVLIPAAGEDLAIVRRTVAAALKIDYENFTVHLLDDSKQGIYKQFAKEVGAPLQYRRRRNIGVEKKAGNLNAATKSLRGYDYCLVLDADFVPRREILNELIPYAAADVGIVQSPQHFDLSKTILKRSRIEFGAGLIQREFYRITQPARNRFGAAICVGTNALYSMPALREVGGFEGVGRKSWAHSEDVNTGLKMLHALNKLGQRYRIVYIPVQLAKGICPADHQSFYKQQNRWATGSLQLMFSRKTLFSGKLSLAQKLCYSIGPVYYLYTIGYLFTPIQLLMLLMSKPDNTLTSALYFVPALIVGLALRPIMMRQKVEPLSTNLVVLSNAYTFLQALILLAIRRPLGWEASGATTKKRSRHFTYFKLTSSLFFIIVYIATLVVILLNERFSLNSSTILIVLFFAAFAAHVVYLYYTFIGTFSLTGIHLKPQFYSYVGMMALALVIATGSYAYGGMYDVRFSDNTIVALTPDKLTTIKAPTPQLKPAATTPLSPTAVQLVSVEGDSQSMVATRIAQQIGARYTISDAQAGKLQDVLLRDMGYSDELVAGTVYDYPPSEMLDLLNRSYPMPYEYDFWNQYSHQVGVR